MPHLIVFLLLAPAAFADRNDDLLAASRQGDLAAVRSLLDAGADIEAKTPYGQTPLYLAAMQGHDKLVEFLLEKGAKADVRDTFYKAPLMAFVAQRKHTAVVRVLVSKGAVDPDSNFSSIASLGSAGLIEAAVATGKVKPETLNRALEIAMENNRGEAAEVLRKAGAQPPAPEPVIAPEVLQSYAGNYKSAQLPIEITISVKDGKLHGQGTGQPEFRFRARSATVFVFTLAGVEIEFEGPGVFTLKQGGQKLLFKKAEAK